MAWLHRRHRRHPPQPTSPPLRPAWRRRTLKEPHTCPAKQGTVNTPSSGQARPDLGCFTSLPACYVHAFARHQQISFFTLGRSRPEWIDQQPHQPTPGRCNIVFVLFSRNNAHRTRLRRRQDGDRQTMGWRVTAALSLTHTPTHDKTTNKRETACNTCLLYTSPSPRDKRQSRMPSSA